MSTFADKLLTAMQKDESVYDSFFRICSEDLPKDTDARYQWLKNNGYIARDEADISVYVAKVAAKHKPKFKWLYENLFAKFPSVFQNELDLVVWGCGCGLDLLALYDRAMCENNPQLWLTIRSVTLADISDAALSRAKEIVTVLFPMAKIKTVRCDFRSTGSVTIGIPESFIYTPRLHLVSNVVDLMSIEQLAEFANFQKRCCARYYSGKSFYNEIFVAFSPEYKNWDWVSTNLKMKHYREAWGITASEIATGGGEPSMCAYATFSQNNIARSLPYQDFMAGNRCLCNLVRVRNRIIDKTNNAPNWTSLHGNLYRLRIGAQSFFDSYEWVYEHYYDDKFDGIQCDGILFVPRGNVSYKAFFVSFAESMNSDKAWKGVIHECGLDSTLAKKFAKATLDVAWCDLSAKEEIKAEDLELSEPCDFSGAFVIDPGDAKPLPDLQGMDKKQREIILGRMQLRRIRGGAGCGKTTTMLWHGVMSILRTHQPVLLTCRTVTLFNHNQRRMAATILKQVPGLEYVDRRLIQFTTIDKYLCEHIDLIRRCAIRHCGWCKLRFVKYRKPGNVANLVPAICQAGSGNLQDCQVLRYWQTEPECVSKDLTSEEKNRLCNICKARAIRGMCKNEVDFFTSVKSFGAVMVDEIQSVEPDMVQALYNLTEAGNPHREFYAFCDERQCLETTAVEMDAKIQKLRVRTPKGRGGVQFRGDWFGLSRPYRQVGELSGVLSEVTKTFQAVTDAKYGNDETEYPPYNGLTGAFNVSRAQNDSNTLCKEVLKAINCLKQVGEKKITVVCDLNATVHSLLEKAGEQNWLSTHKAGATFVEEQKLRNDFKETEDHIGLTTIQLAQGWDLECVILIVTQDKGANEHTVESVLTGITRAKQQLRLIDASPTHWVYDLLKRYN